MGHRCCQSIAYSGKGQDQKAMILLIGKNTPNPIKYFPERAPSPGAPQAPIGGDKIHYKKMEKHQNEIKYIYHTITVPLFRVFLLGGCMALQGVWRWQFISLRTICNDYRKKYWAPWARRTLLWGILLTNPKAVKSNICLFVAPSNLPTGGRGGAKRPSP